MSLHSWLRNLRSALTPGQRQPPRRGSPRAGTHRPHLEVLEDRVTPSLIGPTPWDAQSGLSAEPAVPPFEADVNNDGFLDVVEWNYDYHDGTNIVNVFLGNGNGSFSLWESLQFYDHPIQFYIGDVDHNGLTDVVYTAVDANGDYQFLALLNDGDWGSLEPPPPATPNLSIDDLTVTEGNAGAVSATFNVRLSAASSEAITVDYATADGTATSGDYQAASGTLTFAPGEMSKAVAIFVNGDRLPEPNETFVVNLSGPTNATIADGQGVGTILDDEPRISVSDVTTYEGRKNKITQFTFTVTLSAAYDQPVTMSYSTVNGTATTSNGDYIAKTGTLTFAPGETTKTITIEVKGDSKREANETFYLDLFGLSSNALFTKNRGIGTILNDD